MRSMAAAARRRSLGDQFRLRCVRRQSRGQRLARVLKTAPVPSSVNKAGSREDMRSSASSAMTSSIRSTPAPVFADIARSVGSAAARPPIPSAPAGGAPPAHFSGAVERPKRSSLVRTAKVGASRLGGAWPSPPSLSHQHQVRALNSTTALAPRPPVDRIRTLADARRIDENDGVATQIEKHLDQISRRSRNRRGDGDIAACQCIHERRLAHIGRPGDHDGKALSRRCAASAVASARSIRSIAPRAAPCTRL